MRRIVFLVFCALPVIAFCQSAKGKVEFTVANEQNHSLDAATAELLRAKDSSLVKTALSDKSGVILFDQLQPGSYLIKVSMVGYISHCSSPFTLNDDQPIINLPVVS